jgi:murein L,D-transpeptidase YcbB/YkuD
MTLTIVLSLTLSLALSSAPQASAPTTADPDVSATVSRLLGSAHHPMLRWSGIGDVSRDLWTLYDGEPDRLLWFEGTRPLPTIEGALAAIADARAYGLDADDYDAATLQVHWAALRARPASPAQRAQFDVALSAVVARVLTAVHLGRVDPDVLQWKYAGPHKRIDRVGLLREARLGRGLGDVLRGLEPTVSHYVRARAALATYRQLAEAGEPALVPALPQGQRKLVPGQTWSGVPQLAARLRAVGDLVAETPAASTHYTGAIVDAVKRFQTRHGLESDGVIGGGTLKAINVSLAVRVRQIELAMERMRWLPQLSDQRNIFVNVANFRLWASDPVANDDPLRMNVVVGQSLDHETPLFIERLEYIVFRPFWNPPRGILLDEILPKARRDPGYMARHQYEIVATGADDAPALPTSAENLEKVRAGRLVLRQRPGTSNSLGLAKFIFPNDENVYMHGTPTRGTFARARRDASHGCIRLEDPAALAAWVLRDQPEWTRARIDQAMAGNRPVRVSLRQPMTVVLFYDTVHVSRQGVVFFMDDIYGHDAELDAALRRGYPYPAVRDTAPLANASR